MCQTSWFTIDGEQYPAQPITVTLLPKKLRFFWNPAGQMWITKPKTILIFYCNNFYWKFANKHDWIWLLSRRFLGWSRFFKVWPFHSLEWSISNFPCSLPRNITSHSMKNLAFHSSLRWEMIILPILTMSLKHFSLKGWENVIFWTWEWKGKTQGLTKIKILAV